MYTGHHACIKTGPLLQFKLHSHAIAQAEDLQLCTQLLKQNACVCMRAFKCFVSVCDPEKQSDASRID